MPTLLKFLPQVLQVAFRLQIQIELRQFVIGPRPVIRSTYLVCFRCHGTDSAES